MSKSKTQAHDFKRGMQGPKTRGYWILILILFMVILFTAKLVWYVLTVILFTMESAWYVMTS